MTKNIIDVFPRSQLLKEFIFDGITTHIYVYHGIEFGSLTRLGDEKANYEFVL